MDRDVCAAQLGAWAAGLLAGRPESPDTVAGMAVDGKTRRGSRQPGAPGAPLLSALAHRVGLTLAPHAVADQTHASPVVLELRRQGGLAGRVVTLDAVVPQRAITRQVVEAGGNSVLDVKDPQPQWREARATVGVQAPRADGLRTVAETVDVGHGRIAQRRLQTRAVLADESAWPGLAPVCRRTRQVIRTKTGEVRAAVVLGLTRLPPERAAAARWLALVRGPWHSEHQSPGVREVTLDAERSQVRCGHIPQVMAGLRNTVLGLMRWAGYTHMAAACRRCAAQPALARELIGMRLEN